MRPDGLASLADYFRGELYACAIVLDEVVKRRVDAILEPKGVGGGGEPFDPVFVERFDQATAPFVAVKLLAAKNKMEIIIVDLVDIMAQADFRFALLLALPFAGLPGGGAECCRSFPFARFFGTRYAADQYRDNDQNDGLEHVCTDFPE